MFGKRYRIPVIRHGRPLGSFWMKLYFTTAFSGRRSQTIPLAAHALTTLASSEPAGVDRRLGDLLDLSSTPFPQSIGCSLARVVDPVVFAGSVQSALQRAPYEALARWTPVATLADLSTTDLVTDSVYAPAGEIRGYFEPLGARDQVVEAGNMDVRTARLFAMQALQANDVVIDSDGGCWIAQAATQHYPQVDDYVTLMRYLTIPPPGIVV